MPAHPQDILDFSEMLEFWQEKRMHAYQYCGAVCAEVLAHVEKYVASLPIHSLLAQSSPARAAFEQNVLSLIEEKEREGARIFAFETENGTVSVNALTDYKGWKYTDLTKALLGSSGAASGVTAASRFAPSALSVVGLGALAPFVTPVAITVGAAAVGVSTYSTLKGKREGYLAEVHAAVVDLTIGEHASMLSRLRQRIDQFYKIHSRDF